MKKKIFKYSNYQRLYWVVLGHYYGYPKCCITWFRDKCGKHNANQVAANNYTGFMPCKKCADKIVNGNILKSGLIKNRICPLPFPQSENARARKYFNDFINNKPRQLR